MDERIRRALAAVGSLDEEAARRLEESAREIRGTWWGLVPAGEATGGASPSGQVREAGLD